MDGSVSLWSAQTSLGNRALYHPISYYQKMPNLTGQNAIILDFAPPRPIVEQWLASAKSLLILDHHLSHRDALAGLPNCLIDLGRSGAMLAWEFFHEGEPAPDIVRYAQDRDLWKWKLTDSREYSAAMELVTPTFEAYDRFARRSVADVVEHEGRTAYAYQQALVRQLAAGAVPRKFKGLNALVVNSSVWAGEIGESLAATPGCDIAIIWRYDHDSRSYKISLRSKADDPSSPLASALAAEFPGGGGHANAGAFRWKGKSIEDLFDPA